MTVLTEDRDFAVYLDHVQELPFVRKLELTREPKLGPRHLPALVKLRTARRTFTLALELKRTFLDQTLTNALIAEHLGPKPRHQLPLILARYIPRPTGERLAEAGINFVDRAGNIHLKLGEEYHVLRLGRRQPLPEPTAHRPGPALIQLLLVMLADPMAAGWPVRKLAEAAGIGKTAAATGRKRLMRLGLLTEAGKKIYRVADRKKLAEDFVTGYNQVLRPHLLIGRFRAPEKDPGQLLGKFAMAAKRHKLTWGVTGGPAAHALERFYRGAEIPLFVARLDPELGRDLRVVTDRNGPLVLLRTFGPLCTWRTLGDIVVAHPWLIYAELLCQGEPRALEAAEQLRQKHLGK